MVYYNIVMKFSYVYFIQKIKLCLYLNGRVNSEIVNLLTLNTN